MRSTRTRQPTVAPDDLSTLLPDWSRHLRAMNRAPSTIASYQAVGAHFLAYLEQQGMPTTANGITREHVESYIADMVGTVSPATVAKHYRSLQQLWRWLVEDGEIPDSPMARMRPAAVPEQPVPVLTEDDLRALLKSCQGNTFENRRETAMIRLLGLAFPEWTQPPGRLWGPSSRPALRSPPSSGS
jgi:site-specific recombinase XerD